MKFTIGRSLEILANTPSVFKSLSNDLSDEWLYTNEGAQTWSVFDIVGHLIHGEQTNWLPRVQIILSSEPPKKFKPFDRFAQLEQNAGKRLEDLLNQFEVVRTENIKRLQALEISSNDLVKEAEHPSLGQVKLKELLATWAVHDLNHISQAVRVMASQYSAEVGPYKNYLSVLKS